jgi:hypothetical protein
VGAIRAKPTNVSMKNKVLHTLIGSLEGQTNKCFYDKLVSPNNDGRSLKGQRTNVSMTNRVFVSW